MLRLRYSTPVEWTEHVLGDLDGFLLDHAGCEHKASANAMSFVSHYPDRRELVEAMIALALEELEHFQQVYQALTARNLILRPYEPDAYVAGLLKQIRQGRERYLLDRLLCNALVEARSCERFAVLTPALPPGPLQELYRSLTASEARHHVIFVRLAKVYFPEAEVEGRLDELLDFEAQLVAKLPLRATVH